MSRFARRRPGDYGFDFSDHVQISRLLANGFTDTLVAADTASGRGHIGHLCRIESDGAGPAVVGIGHSLLTSKWIAGQWDDDAGAGAEFTADTTDAQDAGASDFALEAVGQNNDGFVVAATEVFSALRITVGTATVSGGGVVRQWSYWSGSAWTVFTPLAETAGNWAVGVHQMLFVPPADWALTTGAAGEGGVGSGYYAVRYRATTAPDTTAGLATVLAVWDPLEVCLPQVGENEVATVLDSDIGIPLTDSGEALVVAHSAPVADNQVVYVGISSPRVGVRGDQT